MNVKQHQIIRAYKATETIKKNETLPKALLWEIFQLRKKFSPHVEFQEEQEESLRKKYMPYADEEGTIKGQHFQDFMKEVEEIGVIDKELDCEPIELPVVDGLTIEFMEDLDPFVTFKKPE